MDKTRNINSYFEGVIENIDIILNDNFYQNKEALYDVKSRAIEWYDSYRKFNTLTNIDPNELKDMDLEITDFFAQYVAIEPVKTNYSERLSYDFGELEILWKKEMLGEDLND